MNSEHCLVFQLPGGGGGMVPAMARGRTLQKIEIFCQNNHIPYYRTKTHLYELKIWFPEDKHYTIFFLTWNSDKHYDRTPILKKEKYSP